MDEGSARSAFRFHGKWQEFARIAFSNLLLTVVTLGIYRFWATTREREYLWSKTDFIDERLEWTGRGIELFIGFIMVILLLGLPLTAIQLINNGLIFRGEVGLAVIINLLMFLLIFYLTGIAYFRALRYRLSRTYWRGIRGGSNDPGFHYGVSYMWRTFFGWLPLFLMVPWSMISLWNIRWNAMSFGPHRFQSDAQWQPLVKRYLLLFGSIFIGNRKYYLGIHGGWVVVGRRCHRCYGVDDLIYRLCFFYTLAARGTRILQ